MEEKFLILEDVYKIYKNGRKEIRAVNGVSLKVKRGESLAVIGPSGAGKSSLLHLLGGLDAPTRGKVLLAGTDIYRLRDEERSNIRNRKVGFIFQFYHLLPEFTVLENVMLPALIKSRESGIGSREIKERAREILKAIGLGERISHRPAELSGGEAQRVAIARAIINEPEILLCDEPTGNLDSKTSESIYELLLDLKEKNGMTFIIVTHDEKISAKMKNIVYIRDGKIC